MCAKTNGSTPRYTVQFVTALSLDACYERLGHSTLITVSGIAGWLAPMRQRTLMPKHGEFVLERTFPGALHPIRFEGCLDSGPDRQGTWIEGTITRDTANQILIEGLIVFLSFFLLSALFFLRLKARGFMVSVPVLLLLLLICSIRWRALREAPDDLLYWVRRRLYVTPEQVKNSAAPRR